MHRLPKSPVEVNDEPVRDDIGLSATFLRALIGLAFPTTFQHFQGPHDYFCRYSK